MGEPTRTITLNLTELQQGTLIAALSSAVHEAERRDIDPLGNPWLTEVTALLDQVGEAIRVAHQQPDVSRGTTVA